MTEWVQGAQISPGFHLKSDTMNGFRADVLIQGGDDRIEVLRKQVFQLCSAPSEALEAQEDSEPFSVM